ncbi:hypothetical protein ACFU6R_25520 [Streptomyces sp. NPDC057499]|uniref:hypothetical protein n=1 Tax=Streptomyces sp. NPDC057499 TaxID=3346150 RepID=UPI0036A6D4C2
MVRRWVPTLVLGGLWWWAVLRLVLDPADAGLVEGAVAAGGWGLSLLPVHVAATAGPAGAGVAGRWGAGVLKGAERVLRTSGERCVERALRATGKRRVGRILRATRAWLRRRSGGGSGRS